MFRSTGTDTAESAPDVNVAADVIPLSVLQLDLDAPVEGWLVHLNAKGVEVTLDDLGRMSIARVDARRLFTEKREREAEQARRRKLAEAQAVADDQIRRAQIWRGVPADHLPIGATPASVMLAAAKGARPKRVTPLQEALAGSEGMTYHSLSDEDAS
jgi:hypothetical protein